LKPVPFEPEVAEPGESYGETPPATPGRLTPAVSSVAAPPPASSPASVDRGKRPPELVAIGQHRESYILASGPEGLLVIDQHAAHERVLYERMRDRIASGRVLSQKLLMRVLFEASPEEAETLASSFEDLRAAGFEIEPMSGHSYAIAALPAEATDREPAETLHETLASLAEPGASDSARRRDRLAVALACRSAVTIRYHLAPEEIRRLLSDWARAADRFTCPHGRPVVLSMSEEDLEKYFKRR
jgi:DNA mismatch repair protein MutL